VSALKLAILFQMSYPGAPCIYYGDEIGLEGGRDPDCRRAMPWDETRWDTDLLAYYRRLIAIRQAHPALRRGKYVSLHAEDGVYAFLRCLEDEKLVIVLNNGEMTYCLDVPVKGYQPDGAVLCDLLSGGEATVAGGRLRGLSLPPRAGAILPLSPL